METTLYLLVDVYKIRILINKIYYYKHVVMIHILYIERRPILLKKKRDRVRIGYSEICRVCTSHFVGH